MPMTTTRRRGALIVIGVALLIAAFAPIGYSKLRDRGTEPFDPEQHLRLISTLPGNGIGPPDLVSVAPDPVAVDTITFADTELLVVRFDSRITNIGPGPLDIYGNPRTGETPGTISDVVQQRIWDGESWNPVEHPPVKFEAADGHDHFHFMQIARYSLWDADQVRQIAPSTKVGFCLIDSTTDDAQAARAYFSDDGNYCRQGSPQATLVRMGISPGFSDVYKSDVALQWVDVSDVVPGKYYVAGEIDPFNVVVETDETNNSIVFSDKATIVSGHVAQPWAGTTATGEPVAISLRAHTVGVPGGREIQLVAMPRHGSLSAIEAGPEADTTDFLYTPNPGFTGVDSFTYQAVDPTSPYPLTPVESVAIINVGGNSGSVIAIDGRRRTIHTGSTLDLSTIRTDPSQDSDTTWSVEGIIGGSVAVGTIDGDGVYLAPEKPLASVTISASIGTTSAAITIEVISPPNHRPFIEPPLVYEPLADAADTQKKTPVTTLSAGEPTGFLIPATDPNGDPLIFTASNLPPGLTIDPASGFVSGTPTEPGEFTVTFSVDDGITKSSIDVALTVD